VNVGLFGGSFDPIHAGHVAPVQAARRRLGLERVLYLVTADPPHKPKRAVAPPWARYAMVELALLDEPGLFASAHELTPGSSRYTIDTLRHFAAERPDWRLHLILGADSYRDLETWREWRELGRLARLVVLARPHVEVDVERDGVDVLWIDEPRVDCSSTELRAILGRGEAPPRDAIHPRVVQYVHKNDLYR
jgi:nicotinate-nucleotide adenylyltransferase